MVFVLILAPLLGLIPAFIARGKGYPFLVWWIFGTVILVVALPVAVFLQTRRKVAIINKLDDRLHG